LKGAQAPFETPPVLKASQVLPSQLLQSKHHKVLEEVRNDGYLNFYRVSSKFGEFEAQGNTMLLSHLKGISDRAQVVQNSLDVDSEVEARFFVETVGLLSWFHRTQKSITRLLSNIRLLVAQTVLDRSGQYGEQVIKNK
jgi:hypothetical protein